MTIESQPRPQPDWIVSPGEILAEALLERSMSQAELSRRTARPLKTINEIVKGKAAITPDTALQLEYVLGIAARFWLSADREWRERRARERVQHALKGSGSWASKFPVRALAKHQLIPETKSMVEQADALLRFFGVTSPQAWERQWAVTTATFRRPAAFKSERHALAAWLRAGELIADRMRSERFSAKGLRRALPELRELTMRDPLGFEDRLPELLANVGVVLVLLPEFGATRVYGASYWLSPEKAVVQLSARGRKDDQFWFSLFHEIAHLLSGARRESNLDLEMRSGETSETDEDERRANEFARTTLVPDEVIVALGSGPALDEARIRATAEAASVGAGVLVGRLQREGKLTWRQFPRLKRTITFLGTART